MDRKLKIAKAMVRLARKLLFAARFETDDEITAKIRKYAGRLAGEVIESSWFDGDSIKGDVIVKKFNMVPREFMTDEELKSTSIDANQSFPVNLCITVVGDEMTDEDRREAKKAGLNDGDLNIGLGNGGAIVGNGHDVPIVLITITRKDGNGNKMYKSKRYVVSTFKHEAMHVMDGIIERYDSDDRNYIIPNEDGVEEYPGRVMDEKTGERSPTDLNSLFDQRYTEYYTCRNEQNELYSDMIEGLNEYIGKTGHDAGETLARLKECAKDENRMKNFIYDIDDEIGVCDPLMSLFHMLFRKSGARTDDETRMMRKRAHEMIDRIRIIDRPEGK